MTADRLFRNPISWAVLLIVAVLACASVFTVVPETQQALIVRMGVPRAVVNLYRTGQSFGDTGAGLIARVPLLDQIVFVDKRVQTFEAESQPVLSADGRPFSVDAFVRYRVVDPTALYAATHGDPRGLSDALRPMLATALRNQLATLSADRLLTADRGAQMHAVAAAMDAAARRYGARVAEVRLDRIALPDGAPLDAAIGRMRDVREQNAMDIRRDGNKQAEAISNDADAETAKIYADAYGQDPQFYDFYRAMNSYQITLGKDAKGATQFVLSPNSEYLHEFRSGGKQ